MDDLALDLDLAHSGAIERADASDGYRLSYRMWRPVGPSRGTIALFNGIMSHSGWFAPLVTPLCEAGFTLCGVDRRGSGLNAQDRGDAPSARHIIDDARTILAHAVSPGTPLLLAGWCWGSILALNLLRPLGDAVDGLALLTPGLFPTPEVIAAAKRAKADTADAPQDAAVVPLPIADTMFTRGPSLHTFVRTDPLRLQATTPRFMACTKSLSMGAMLAVRKLSLPTLLVLAEHDEATDNAATRGALDERPCVATEVIPGAHGLQFDAPDALARSLRSFFEGLLEHPAR